MISTIHMNYREDPIKTNIRITNANFRIIYRVTYDIFLFLFHFRCYFVIHFTFIG